MEIEGAVAVVTGAGGAIGGGIAERLAADGASVVVNLKGVMLGTHHAIEAMRRLGGGTILNVSSSAGIGFRAFGAPEYSTAKAGIWRLSASLGGLAEEGIRVNAICPDWVENAGMRRARAEMGEEAWAKMAPPVLVQPPEIADVVVRMLRDDTMSGRVMLCPCGGEWGLVPVDTDTPVEPLA